MILNINYSIAQNEIWDAQFLSTNAPNDTVFAIATDGSNIFIGGKFNSVAGSSANYIAMWDGVSWSSLGSGMDATVRTLFIDNGILYAGGDFTTAGGITVNHLAAWNGTSWSAIGNGTDGVVKELLIKDGNLYIGGYFSNAGAVPANNIAMWDGSVWNALATGTNGSVLALATDGTDIYVGGDFTSAGGVIGTDYIAKWNGTIWSAMATGTNGKVNDIVCINPSTIIVGEFTQAGTTTVNHISKWDGSVFGAYGTGTNGNVYCIEEFNSDIYIGGAFTDIDGVTVNNLAKYNSTSWTAIGDGTDNNIYALKDKGFEMHAGGAFLNAGTKSSEYFARIMILPIITLDPIDVDACLYDTVTFFIDAEGTEPMSFQWQLDGYDILGATDTFITIYGITPPDAGNYKCIVTNAVGSVASGNGKLLVHMPPSFVLQPASSSNCEYESVNFNSSASTTTPMTFQWQFNSSDIAGATTSSYSILSVMVPDSGSYICIATNTCGSDTTNIAYLNVHQIPNVSLAGLDTSYCVDSPLDTLIGLPYGGTFSGIGMTDSIFDPSGITGIHDIIYTFTTPFGCSNADTMTFEGHTLPNVTFTGLNNGYCVNWTQDTLNGMPQDGNYIGLGIMNDYIFYPDIAGPGYHQIVYEFTDKWGCYNTDTNYTTVYEMPAVNVGADTDVCMGDSLTLTISGDFGMYGWFFTPVINTSIVVYPVSDTTYSGWIMSAFGCLSVDTINVYTHAVPTGVSFSGLNAEYCNSAEADTLYGTPVGGSYINPEIENDIFYPTLFSPGINEIIYQYTDSNGCSGYDTSSVIIKPVVNISFTGYDLWYCESAVGDTLIPTPAGGYFTGGNMTSNYFDPSIAGIGIQTIVYNLLDTNGCTARDTAMIDVLELPVIDLVDDTSFCQGDTLTIFATCPDALTYHWSNSQSGNTIVVSPTNSTTYYLTVTNPTCVNFDSVLVTLYPMSNVDLGADRDLCREELLHAGPGFAVYQWSNPNVSDSLLSVDQTGLYSVTVTSIDGCVDNDSVFITILPTPYVDLGTDMVITTDQTVVLGAGPGYNSYLWSTGETSSMIALDGSLLGLGDHYIWGEAFTSNGCSNVDTILITVIFGLNVNDLESEAFNIYPNPATDYFHILTDNVKVNKIKINISDVTGKIVFTESLNIQNSKFNQRIDMTDKAKGVYFINIETDKFKTSSKIILQ